MPEPALVLSRGLRPESWEGKAILVQLTLGQKAAVLLMCLPPEMSAELFRELGAEDVRAITLEITQLPHIAPEVRESVVAEFINGVGFGIPGLTLEGDGLLSVLQFFVQRNPLAAARRLKAKWLGALRAVDSLEPIQKAAILIMSLPSAMSTNLFIELGREQVQAITAEITQLPDISPEIWESVLKEFLRSADLDFSEFAAKDAGIGTMLEAFVGNQTEAAAELLSCKWLGDVGQVQAQRRTIGDALVSLGGAFCANQKLAMFMQSLPIPLAVILLGAFPLSERSRLVESMEKYGSLKSPISEAAWVELMTPEAIEDGLDVKLLWEALEEMIRNEPEVVVDRIRKRWLSKD